jgi:hypothetical protein
MFTTWRQSSARHQLLHSFLHQKNTSLEAAVRYSLWPTTPRTDLVFIACNLGYVYTNMTIEIGDECTGVNDTPDCQCCLYSQGVSKSVFFRLSSHVSTSNQTAVSSMLAQRLTSRVMVSQNFLHRPSHPSTTGLPISAQFSTPRTTSVSTPTTSAMLAKSGRILLVFLRIIPVATWNQKIFQEFTSLPSEQTLLS